MSTLLYFDCFSGISGDMALGALLDAGVPLDSLRAELAKLNLPGWQLDAERGMRSFLAGTRALVHAPEQATHRHLSDVRAILDGSSLSAEVRRQSLAVFTRLAAAEGRIHGIPAEQVHFHEVGALDAIVDIVGVVAGLALLGIETVYASALPLGSGWARAAHGRLPVPAPATLALLADAGAPLLADDTPGELVTPTGAALLAELATFRRPAMRIERVGYGLGTRNPPDRPNALRVWIGTTAEEMGRQGSEASQQPAPFNIQNSTLPHSPAPILLETNIDDQPAEQLAYVVEQLMALGAHDAWLAPIVMKKGRAATLLSALVPAAHEEAATSLLLRETTTLGIRRRRVERYVAERSTATVSTPWGDVRVKRKHWQGDDLGAAPEYEDCARLARAHGVALRDVYLAAMRAAAQL